MSVEQLKEAWVTRIAINPSLLSITRYPTKLNENDESIPDYSQTPSAIEITGRISRIKKGPPVDKDAETFYKEEHIFYLVTDDLSQPVPSDQFDWNGDVWKVVKVDPVIKFEALIGYQSGIVKL